nr:DUF6805 domain-containing protein [Mucilaginibacter sp. OK268]
MSILVNDRELKKVDHINAKQDSFFTLAYDLPGGLDYAGDLSINVKFLAEKGSVAGPVYEIRLLKN